MDTLVEEQVAQPEVQEGTRITDKAVILLVSKSYWSGSKTVRSNSVDVTPVAEPVDELLPKENCEEAKKPAKNWLYISKLLISSKKFNAIFKADDKITARLDYLALPSPLRASRMIPLGNFVEADKLLTDYVPVRKKLVDEWCDSGDYPKEIEGAKERLGPLFNEKDYPTVEVLRASFSISWKWIQIGVSEGLKALSQEIYLREREKAEAEWKEVGEEMQNLLRSSMSELVNGLVDKLTPSEDGKQKAFRATSLNGLRSFLSTFDVKNISGDVEMKKLVDQMKALTEGTDVETIKSNEAVRSNMQRGFTEVKATLDEMIVTGPRRKVRF